MQPSSITRVQANLLMEVKREIAISRSIVRAIAKDDLKLKIFRRHEVQQLSDSDAKKWLRACMHLKQRMTVNKTERTWFIDEKILTVQTPTNTQNDRVLKKRDVKQIVKMCRQFAVIN